MGFTTDLQRTRNGPINDAGSEVLLLQKILLLPLSACDAFTKAVSKKHLCELSGVRMLKIIRETDLSDFSDSWRSNIFAINFR